MVLFHTYEYVLKAYHCHQGKYCQIQCQKEPQNSHCQGPFVLELRGLSVWRPLQEEEEHLGQPEQGWWDNFEIFYVVLIGPFVKFYHLIYIYVISVLSVVEYWEGQNLP